MMALSDREQLRILLIGLRAELSIKQKARKTVRNIDILVQAAEGQVKK